MLTELTPRIRKLATKFWYRGARHSLDATDLEQAAAIRILHAHSRFDPSKSKWSTFGMRHAYYAMQDALREQDHVPRLARQRAKEEGRELPRILSWDTSPFEDVPRDHADPRAPRPPELAARADVWRRVRKILGMRGALVVEAYYRRERTLKEIGEEIGVSESRACQLLRLAHKTLRALWGKEDA